MTLTRTIFIGGGNVKNRLSAFLSAFAEPDSAFAKRLSCEKPQYHDKTAEELFLMQGITADN